MKQISGIYYFNGRTVGPEDFAELATLADLPFGLDQIRTGPGLVMAESCGHTAVRGDRFVCQFDGRLDNRRDLQASPGSDGTPLDNPAAFALALLQEGSPARLGKFGRRLEPRSVGRR